MRYRYLLRSSTGKTAEIEDNPMERGSLERLVAAVRALRSFPGEQIFIDSEPLGPEHISGPLNRVFEEIEAARKGGAK